MKQTLKLAIRKMSVAVIIPAIVPQVLAIAHPQRSLIVMEVLLKVAVRPRTAAIVVPKAPVAAIRREAPRAHLPVRPNFNLPKLAQG
jgi:hypothetical protein